MLLQPLAAFDELVAEVPQMRDRPAERRQAEFQERREDLSGTPFGIPLAHANVPAADINASSPRR
jgi:hypothetical protein